MLKKKGIYIVSILIILLVIIISFSKANYKQIIQGNGVVSIAKPIVEIKAGNKIYFLPYKYINIKPAYFKTTLKLFHFHQ